MGKYKLEGLWMTEDTSVSYQRVHYSFVLLVDGQRTGWARGIDDDYGVSVHVLWALNNDTDWQHPLDWGPNYKVTYLLPMELCLSLSTGVFEDD